MEWFDANLLLSAWRELPDASIAAAGAAVAARDADVFFAAAGGGVDLPYTVRPCGVRKEWSDLPSAAAAILSAWYQSNCWKRDATKFSRAYGRVRQVQDCVLFGVCTTVYFGVAEAGAEIMRAPKKTAAFVFATRHALRVATDGQVVKVEPGNGDLFDSKDGLSVSTWLPKQAARAAGEAESAATRKRHRNKHSDCSSGVGFVVGVVAQGLKQLSHADRQKRCAAVVELFSNLRAAHNGKRCAGNELDDVGDEAAQAAQPEVARHCEIGGVKIDAASCAAAGADAVHVPVDNATAAAGAACDQLASDSAARAAAKDTSDSAARAAAKDNARRELGDVSVAATVAGADDEVGDASLAARAAGSSPPRKQVCTTWHRKPWHHGVLVHRVYVPGPATGKERTIWQRCVRSFGETWTQYVWAYSLEDFYAVVGADPPYNVVHMNVALFLSRGEFDDFARKGLSSQHIKDIVQMRILAAFGGWFVDFDAAWLGGSPLSASAIEQGCVAERSANAERLDSQETVQCILACQLERATSQYAKMNVVKDANGPAACYLGVAWARQGSLFVQKAASAMTDCWGNRNVVCRKVGPVWNKHQDLLQDMSDRVDSVALARVDAFCPLPRFLSSFDVLADGDATLYGATIASRARIAKESFMVSVWSGVWPDALSHQVLDWAGEVAVARGSPTPPRRELRADIELSRAVRAAVCDALESSLGVLRACGFDTACAFDLLARSSKYLEHEQACQGLVAAATQAIGLAAGAAMRPQDMNRLSAFVAAALLQGSAKQVVRRVDDPTGVANTGLVSRAVLRALQVEETMTDIELIQNLDNIFINSAASVSIDMD